MARTFLWVSIFIVSAIFMVEMVESRRSTKKSSSSEESGSSEEVFDKAECKQLRNAREIYRSIRNGVCKEKSKTCAVKCVVKEMGFLKGKKFEVASTIKGLGEYLTGEALRKFEIITHRCFKDETEYEGEEKFSKESCKTVRRTVKCALKRSQALGCLLDSRL